MFRSARLKLTTWYLLIIMLISVSFSVVIYKELTSELDRVERIQRLRMQNRFPEQFRIEQSEHPFFLDQELVKETKERLGIILVSINVVILGFSAGFGYFLAGKTLKPIKEMVDEQNRFIRDASHELRTPLTSLKSEIEVNLRNKKLTLDEAKKILKSNLEDVNNLQVLSDGLIKLSQYQKSENGLIITDLSLINVVDDAVKKVSNLAKNKKITIINKIKDSAIKGNKPALTELFVILLDNAIKYSRNNSKINLTSKKTDGHIQIFVADKGMGIDEKDIPHLFDRFYRVDKSRTRTEVSGYGLGLSIAKQIVERHSGSISVKSILGKGTTFIIQLP